VPPGRNRVRELGYSSFVAIDQGIQWKVSSLSLSVSTSLLCDIKSQKQSLSRHSASSGPLIGCTNGVWTCGRFCYQSRFFLALGSVDCVDYTCSSIGIHSTTTREGSKSFEVG
jgi:hypothetical protein